MLRTLDLFSGIGGFSLGLEASGGFQTVAFCESDRFCRGVLQKHWEGVPIYDDVRQLTGAQLAAAGISVDVICGGFPCQDLSTAGRGGGLDGRNSGLWREFARLIGEVGPRYALVENVAALISRGLGRVLGDLAALGYDAEWHCVPAAAVGAPHLRDRIWIIAYPGRDLLRQQQQRQPARHANGVPHQGQAVAGDDGAQGSVADADIAPGQPPLGAVDGACAAALGRGPAEPGGRARAHSDADRGRREGERLAQHHAVEGASGHEPDRLGARRRRNGTASLSDADDERRGQGSGARARHQPDQRGAELADAGSARLPLSQPAPLLTARRWQEGRAAAECGWWRAEPDVGRVAHGIPTRVDRLRTLGNALVPQIPQVIGWAILDHERER